MFFRNFTGASEVNGLWDSNAFDGSVIRIWNVCSATSSCGSSTEWRFINILFFRSFNHPRKHKLSFGC